MSHRLVLGLAALSLPFFASFAPDSVSRADVIQEERPPLLRAFVSRAADSGFAGQQLKRALGSPTSAASVSGLRTAIGMARSKTGEILEVETPRRADASARARRSDGGWESPVENEFELALSRKSLVFEQRTRRGNYAEAESQTDFGLGIGITGIRDDLPPFALVYPPFLSGDAEAEERLPWVLDFREPAAPRRSDEGGLLGIELYRLTMPKGADPLVLPEDPEAALALMNAADTEGVTPVGAALIGAASAFHLAGIEGKPNIRVKRGRVTRSTSFNGFVRESLRVDATLETKTEEDDTTTSTLNFDLGLRLKKPGEEAEVSRLHQGSCSLDGGLQHFVAEHEGRRFLVFFRPGGRVSR